MADPSPTHLEHPVEPGQLNEANHVTPDPIPKDINRGSMIQDVPRIGSYGLVATKHFEEGEMILAAPAGLARLQGIFPHQLDGRSEFYGAPQVRIDAMHTVAAAMDAYENGWGLKTSDRPFPPCIPVAEAVALLKKPPNEKIEEFISIMRTTQFEPFGNSSDRNDGPKWEESTEVMAWQALRFLDGALVAEDASPRHLMYSHFTSYVSTPLS